MTNHKTYLGDGVYADTDGFHIILTTENGIETTNTVFLDPTVMSALDKYHANLLDMNTAHEGEKP